jgi:uncharacterized protein YhbP (UPF0306 family)
LKGDELKIAKEEYLIGSPYARFIAPYLSEKELTFAKMTKNCLGLSRN